MIRIPLALVICFSLLPGCDGGGSGEDLLQSPCVLDQLNLERTLPDGVSCSNFSYSDCGVTPMASECVNYCAFGVCQPAPCVQYEDCTGYGADFDCMPYVVSGDDYGAWCGESDCPRGHVDCPCLPGGLCPEPDDYWVLECDAQNFCRGEDTCPFGCRSGSVCCGGAFCGGDCIGTPCC